MNCKVARLSKTELIPLTLDPSFLTLDLLKRDLVELLSLVTLFLIVLFRRTGDS